MESLHTGPARPVEASAPTTVVAANGLETTSVQAAGSDECPACNWLRLGRRLESRVGLVRTQDVVLADAPTLIAEWPASPVPHTALLRGPPRSVLS